MKNVDILTHFGVTFRYKWNWKLSDVDGSIKTIRTTHYLGIRLQIWHAKYSNMVKKRNLDFVLKIRTLDTYSCVKLKTHEVRSK